MKNTKSTYFSDLLKGLMGKYGLNQSQLSEKTGIPQGRISEYINSKTEPSLENIQKIASAFDISLSDFFSTDQERPPAAPPATVQPPAPATISPERELELLRQVSQQVTGLLAKEAELKEVRDRRDELAARRDYLADELHKKDEQLKEKDKIIDGKNEIIKQLSEANGKLIDILKEAGEEDLLPPELIFSTLASLTESRNSEK